MGRLLFNGMLGLHVQFLRHLVAVVGEEIIVERLVVASYGTTDGGGMGCEDSPYLGNGRLKIEGGHTGHPLVCLKHHLVRFRQIIAIEALYHLSGGESKHGCFIIIAISMQ